MMLKLRAWDEHRRKMIYRFDDRGWKPTKYRLIFNEDGELLCGNYKDNGDWNEPKLMQFTGFSDSKGNPIYEGDIVKLFHGHPSWIVDPFFIVFQNGAFALKKPGKSGSTSFAVYLHDCVKNGVINEDSDDSLLFEVIGNLHENPELIKS